MERDRTVGSEFLQNDLLPVKHLRVERAGACELGDFSINRRVLTLSGIPVFLEAVSAVLALCAAPVDRLGHELVLLGGYSTGAPGDLDG